MIEIIIWYLIGYILGIILFHFRPKKFIKEITKIVKNTYRPYIKAFKTPYKERSIEDMMDDEAARYKNRTKITPNFYK